MPETAKKAAAAEKPADGEAPADEPVADPNPQAEFVEVEGPGGATGTVPAKALPRWESKGYKKVG